MNAFIRMNAYSQCSVVLTQIAESIRTQADRTAKHALKASSSSCFRKKLSAASSCSSAVHLDVHTCCEKSPVRIAPRFLLFLGKWKKLKGNSKLSHAAFLVRRHRRVFSACSFEISNRALTLSLARRSFRASRRGNRLRELPARTGWTASSTRALRHNR